MKNDIITTAQKLTPKALKFQSDTQVPNTPQTLLKRDKTRVKQEVIPSPKPSTVFDFLPLFTLLLALRKKYDSELSYNELFVFFLCCSVRNMSGTKIMKSLYRYESAPSLRQVRMFTSRLCSIGLLVRSVNSRRTVYNISLHAEIWLKSEISAKVLREYNSDMRAFMKSL